MRAVAQQPPPPPPGYMPPPPAPAPTSAPAAGKVSFQQWFRVSPWWQKLLVALPLVLVFLGGLLGALTGVLIATANMAILRSRLGMPAKVLLCVGLTVAGAIAFVLVVAIIQALIGH
jgi:hypothetical protein